MRDVTEPIPAIERSLDVAVSPADAWATITDPERIAEWFTEASPLGVVGHDYRLDFGDGSVVEGEVLAVDPGRSFAYAWRWAGSPPTETTRVTWSVEPRHAGAAATIRLVHDGWAAAGLEGSARDDHDGYWAGYLEDLEAVLAGQT